MALQEYHRGALTRLQIDLTDLCALVTANKLDHGFALDLDADRLVVVNSKGEKLSADATLLLCVARAIEIGLKKFVTSIDTSIAIEKYIRDRAMAGLLHTPKWERLTSSARCLM